MSDFKYSISLQWSEEDQGYVALVPELSGVSAVGDTPEIATSEVLEAAKLYLESLKEDEEEIPHPSMLSEFSGQLRLRMPKQLHRDLSIQARLEDVSLNQFLVYLLTKSSSIITVEKINQSKIEGALRSVQSFIENTFATDLSGSFTERNLKDNFTSDLTSGSNIYPPNVVPFKNSK